MQLSGEQAFQAEGAVSDAEPQARVCLERDKQ